MSMEEDVEALSNVDKAGTGEEISGTDGETPRKLDESDAKNFKDAGEDVDQIASAVNESKDGVGGRVGILDDQVTGEALEVDVGSSEMIVAKSVNSHVESEGKEELGRSVAAEKVEEKVKDSVDGQLFTELPMGDGDEVEAEGVNEFERVEDGKTELVDGGTEAKCDKVETQGGEGHVEILSEVDITMIEVRREAMMAEEQIEDAVGVSRHECNSEFTAGMEVVDADACCKLEELKGVDGVGTMAPGGKDENVGADVLNGSKLGSDADEHDVVRCEHTEHCEMGDQQCSVNGISGSEVLKDENMRVEFATDSKVEEPTDKDGQSNDVKHVECLESAMAVDEGASMEAPNNSRLEESMVRYVEEKQMDDVNGLEHVSKESEHMVVETSVESITIRTIDASESGNTTLMIEEHPLGNIRTETDATEEAELTKKDIPDTTESRDAPLETEERLAGDIRMDVRAGEEAEFTRKDIMEGTSLDDDDVVFDVGTTVLADEPQDEVTGIDSDETRSDVDEPVPKRNDSSGTPQDGEDVNMVAKEDTETQDTEMETETDVAESGKTSGGKRKRDNISKIPNSKATPRATSKKSEGEDVCFICFDGGELVLCDRRGCPKAYHPSCVNRDEAFFKSKGRWNCGWHFCSICEKNARYMCYTCTFSLCNSCIKGAVFFCVRETKGFCGTCMKSVRLIDNSKQESKDVMVDFDDKNSWDYLFKDYYIELKEKLSLSSAEISGARNPIRVGGMLSDPSKEEPFEARADAGNGESGSDNFVGNSASNKPMRKISKKAKSTPNNDVVPRGKAASSIENLDWTSKELLEFVSYMKNGDTSMISQYDVQALLLDYIKRKNLRDPRRKSQIICDARLQKLFGKPRVGHFEMLKLLESHFLLKGEHNDDIQVSSVDTESQLDIEPPAKAKKRKARRKGRDHQSNLEDYAAIDMHNINLIYLRRKLVEDLLDDADNFSGKVVGTFVRIRIVGSNQKQDLYRLVQVVGTSKAQDPYKVGKKTIDIMLDILNLDKNETVSIDTLSNQEFTEEECKRLRQSIKCGFISRLTVGEILDKTVEIQIARVNDWLESETMRLSHLRDRASDLGRRKELRECVDKLQILKTPEERQRRMAEIPEIHSDPKMNPAYESDENSSAPEDTKRDVFAQTRASSFNQRARGPISPVTDKDSWSGSSQTPSRLSGNMPGNNNFMSSGQISETASENLWKPKRDRRLRELNLPENFSIKTEPSVPRYESLSVASSSTLLPPSSLSPVVKTEPPSAHKMNESEKMWNYKDPSGKVQGPFSIVQLRKWNNNGYFPSDLKIWKAEDVHENSILLTEALAGKFPKELPHSPANSLRGSQSSAGHHSSQEGKERPSVQQTFGSTSNFSSEKWGRTESTNLPSPTPGQQTPFAIESAAVNIAAVAQSLPSPTPISPNLMEDNSNLNSPLKVLSGVISPTPNTQESMLTGPTNPPQSQATTTAGSSSNGAVQSLMGQNPPADPQNWSGGGPQSAHQQHQVYGWGPPNIQNPGSNLSSSGQTIGVVQQQPNFWGPTQMQQPGSFPANVNQGWSAPWVGGGPGQGPMPGGGWVPQGGNMNQGQPVPAGNTSQGRPWNNNGQQRPYGGAWRRDTVCPYNANGRCRKGSRCDYRHV